MNSVNLTGRLIHDPTRRETHRGVVASFRLAVDGRPRVWIDVEAWGHIAGTVATYLTARRHVAVTGRLGSASTTTTTATSRADTSSSVTTSVFSTTRTPSALRTTVANLLTASASLRSFRSRGTTEGYGHRSGQAHR